MVIFVSLAGNTAGDGFLLAALGSTYQAELLLWTDAGTAAVTLQASPNPAGLVFSNTALNLTTAPTSVMVHATAQSAARQDTTIEVRDGATVVATFTVTSIKHPVVHFRGRFEARFGTDGGGYNRNPMCTATNDTVLSPLGSEGWTFGLEGEPDFVPAVGNVPKNLDTVGRVVRFNNPVALRSHVAPVVTTVDAIIGTTTSEPDGSPPATRLSVSRSTSDRTATWQVTTRRTPPTRNPRRSGSRPSSPSPCSRCVLETGLGAGRPSVRSCKRQPRSTNAPGCPMTGRSPTASSARRMN